MNFVTGSACPLNAGSPGGVLDFLVYGKYPGIHENRLLSWKFIKLCIKLQVFHISYFVFRKESEWI